MKPNHDDFLRDALQRGCDMDTALTALHKRGAGPIETIKAIRAATGVGLGEAKRIFEASKEWGIDIAEREKFLDELIAAIEAENKSE